jgi:hypothetical protein
MTNNGLRSQKGINWYVNNLNEELKRDIHINLEEQGNDFKIDEYLLKTIIKQFPHTIEAPLNTYQRS